MDTVPEFSIQTSSVSRLLLPVGMHTYIHTCIHIFMHTYTHIHTIIFQVFYLMLFSFSNNGPLNFVYLTSVYRGALTDVDDSLCCISEGNLGSENRLFVKLYLYLLQMDLPKPKLQRMTMTEYTKTSDCLKTTPPLPLLKSPETASQ